MLLMSKNAEKPFMDVPRSVLKVALPISFGQATINQLNFTARCLLFYSAAAFIDPSLTANRSIVSRYDWKAGLRQAALDGNTIAKAYIKSTCCSHLCCQLAFNTSKDTL